MIYMIKAGYFEDDNSDEFTNDPVFKAILEKDHWHPSQHYQDFSTGWTRIH